MLKALEKDWLEEEKKKRKGDVIKIKNNTNFNDDDMEEECENMSVDSDDSDATENESTKFKKHHGCSVTLGEIWNGYATLMTKIDVAVGAWGLYNYYRMEVRFLNTPVTQVSHFDALRHSMASHKYSCKFEPFGAFLTHIF